MAKVDKWMVRIRRTGAIFCVLTFAMHLNFNLLEMLVISLSLAMFFAGYEIIEEESDGKENH